VPVHRIHAAQRGNAPIAGPFFLLEGRYLLGILTHRYRRSAWGRGLATEAAAPLVRIGLADPATTAVVACALAGNAGSLRVLEKLGLERVGEVMLAETNEPTVKLARVK
jgi:RimJ/RimL family protein N-acetyltransferase